MRVLHGTGLDRAAEFMRLNGRLIDRRRFALHFRGGRPGPVVAALRGYENPDGGYGHALEPDLRGEASQPVPAQHALDVLHQAGADADPAVDRIGDYLASITGADGGAPFVLPSVRDAPHGPWWRAADEPSGAINPTGSLAGRLYRAGSSHPWTGPATDFCWRHLEDADIEPGPYDALSILTFLDHVPDRERAEAAFARVRDALAAPVSLDPHAAGARHLPLDFAPFPGGFGRRLFADDVIDAHLDALIDAQDDDGGWDIGFLVWTPITRPEWRGFVTVESLRTLRAYGRLKP
ncbi:hypothetical protein ACFOY4_17825 [Actinomadura syzygii]|uniref:Uncharacterized protein n=1 Tax=Actinomadura syzygii TaxID=1427538 RepID=A0A5D0TXK6_9ACTN|nr:hypothetical protein [Actinomadura syzygii]TYC11051.1 hypothetical protein FXF65_29230 [Actinomadura syzygii]